MKNIKRKQVDYAALADRKFRDAEIKKEEPPKALEPLINNKSTTKREREKIDNAAVADKN